MPAGRAHLPLKPTRDLALLYSDRGTSDAPSPRSGPLRTAVADETASAVSGLEGAGGRLLEIYVPIRLAGDRRPGDVLELHLPYAPVEATIEQRTMSLALVLGVGALLFLCALMPSVLRGSRALADLYEARQMPLQRRLRRAMRDGELALAYQPKLDLHTGEISGVEALLRWRPATGRAIPPGEFVPLVEATAVMEALTSHVFELAVRQSAAWAREGIELDVAVNISACNLRDEGLAQRMAERSVAYGLRPESFTLELTESGVSNAPDRELETLRSLRARGFKLSIDDFGIGESSLSRIDLVEFQEVKIDRSFIRHLGEERDPVLVAGIIDLVQAPGPGWSPRASSRKAPHAGWPSSVATRSRASTSRTPSLRKTSSSGWTLPEPATDKQRERSPCRSPDDRAPPRGRNTVNSRRLTAAGQASAPAHSVCSRPDGAEDPEAPGREPQ